METRCVLLLLCASCGGGTAGEIDLILENRTAGALVATTPNDCGAGYVQIFDGDDGRALAWRCGAPSGARVSADAIAEPIVCNNQVTSIPAGGSLTTRWNGFYNGGSGCDESSSGPFEAQFCFGTMTRMQMGPLGEMEEVVDDLRCESASFRLGEDAEARVVVE